MFGNRPEGSDLGCKMERNGPLWDGTWRGKDATWEHGHGACALDNVSDEQGPGDGRSRLFGTGSLSFILEIWLNLARARKQLH